MGSGPLRVINDERAAPSGVQRMSAGTGVTHGEFNASKTEPVHSRQIWIVPKAQGVDPAYEQSRFPRKATEGGLRLIADRRAEIPHFELK